MPELPADKPRYLMGVGAPEDIVEGVARGIDIFDCVLPTRVARNGGLLTRQGRMNLRNARYAADPLPIEPGCDCYACQHFSRAYLRHLFKAGGNPRPASGDGTQRPLHDAADGGDPRGISRRAHSPRFGPRSSPNTSLPDQDVRHAQAEAQQTAAGHQTANRNAARRITMNIIQAIILGIVQGVTEFITGEQFGAPGAGALGFGWPSPGLAFDTILHWGTLTAVMIYFWRDWVRVIKGFFRSLTTRGPWNAATGGRLADADSRLAWWIIIGTIPADGVGPRLQGFLRKPLQQPARRGRFAPGDGADPGPR